MPEPLAPEVAAKFYDAFARRDAAAMCALYAPGATFEDPAFGRLDSRQAQVMWRALIRRGKDLAVTYRILEASDREARVKWVATYTFTQTGRPVVNEIEAHLVCENGLIVRHTDRFDLWAWSRQAFGLPGLLLGWTPMWRAKVQATARAALGSSGT